MVSYKTAQENDSSLVFTCLQVDVLEVERPQSQEAVLWTSHTERLVDTHTVDGNAPTCSDTEGSKEGMMTQGVGHLPSGQLPRGHLSSDQMKKWTLAQWQQHFHKFNVNPNLDLKNNPNFNCIPNLHITPNPNLVITFHDCITIMGLFYHWATAQIFVWPHGNHRLGNCLYPKDTCLVPI